jgi:signal transduction histidine kinase
VGRERPSGRPFRGSRDRNSQGLGLGLYIARDIVVGHGGTIDVTSSDAIGTTFQIRLPRYATPRRSHDALSAWPESGARNFSRSMR